MHLQIKTDRRREKIEKVLKQKQPNLTLVLENIHDPHNVSAILRTCDAIGVLEVQLVYTNEKFPKISNESSGGAMKWMNVNKFKSFTACRDYLKERNFLIAASHLEQFSCNHNEIDFTRNIALVFGNENRGISSEFLPMCDFSFKIPMHGMIQSLNVSVAAAVTLYEAERQLRLNGAYDTIRLDKEKYNQLMDQWIIK